jgi:hypothetical protein
MDQVRKPNDSECLHRCQNSLDSNRIFIFTLGNRRKGIKPCLYLKHACRTWDPPRFVSRWTAADLCGNNSYTDRPRIFRIEGYIYFKIYFFVLILFSFLGWSWTESTITEVTSGLFYQTRMMMMMTVEQSVEWLAGESEVLGENLSLCRFVYHKSHMTWPGPDPWPPRWEVQAYPSFPPCRRLWRWTFSCVTFWLILQDLWIMKWKERGRIVLLSWHLVRGTGENQDNIRVAGPRLGNMNPEPPDYEIGVLTSPSRTSISRVLN